MARRSKHTTDSDDNLHRWLISYSDFITLLFAFFVVMYSISSVNEGKYRVLSESLLGVFSKQPTAMLENQGSQTIEIAPYDSNSMIDFPETVHKGAGNGSNGLEQLLEQVESAFGALIDDEQIIITGNETWIEISLNSSLLFNSGEARLNKRAVPIVQQLAGIMSGYENPVRVEGFTDKVPIKSLLYPSNWELSASRSAAVVRMLVEEGINPDKLSAVGYGEYQPIASNATEDGRRQNRRVVLVVSRNLDVRRPFMSAAKLKKGTAGEIADENFLKEKDNVKMIELEGGGVLFTQGEE